MLLKFPLRENVKDLTISILERSPPWRSSSTEYYFKFCFQPQSLLNSTPFQQTLCSLILPSPGLRKLVVEALDFLEHPMTWISLVRAWKDFEFTLLMRLSRNLSMSIFRLCGLFEAGPTPLYSPLMSVTANIVVWHDSISAEAQNHINLLKKSMAGQPLLPESGKHEIGSWRLEAIDH